MVARFPRRTNLFAGRMQERQGPHLVQPLDNLIAWPTELIDSDDPILPRSLSAEIRIKRFSGLSNVDQSIAKATIESSGSSPAAMISALSAAVAQDPDLTRPAKTAIL